ncbi:hypothetical protein H6P81_001273 [Aristolochia fimbriata]|uniref:Uncharacterized protein n=1 Tax=Aristolochia fimbriata TaxID=158543 RepID=A0AAV7F6D5_ARIFI|nr:hypothetical protein H6P81_001273 [Aristolochia fimbriata]
MENLAAILSAISSSKDTLDQVNKDIESTIQQTREIEYEIVKCLEIEKSLLLREADLTKMASVTEFEIHSLTQVIVVASSSLDLLKKEVDCLRTNREDIVKRMSENRENFIVQCETFQRDNGEEENGVQMLLLREKDSLQKEIFELNTKISSLKSSTSLYLEEVLEGLHKSNTMLQVDIQRGTKENDRLLRDIEHLKDSILALSTCDTSGLTVSSPKRLKYSYMEKRLIA